MEFLQVTNQNFPTSKCSKSSAQNKNKTKRNKIIMNTLHLNLKAFGLSKSKLFNENVCFARVFRP